VGSSPDARPLLPGGADSGAPLGDAAPRRPIGERLPHQAPVAAVAFSPDGTTLLTGSWDSNARLWDAATARPLGAPMRHQAAVIAVAFSPDGKTLLTASMDGVVRLWPTAELPDDPERVTAWVEVLTALTLDASGSIQVLDTATWLERREQVKRQGGPPVTSPER